MKYFSVHFKRRYKTRGFIAMRQAETIDDARQQAERSGFGTKYFADLSTLKEVSAKAYNKWFKKNFPDK